MRRKKFFIPLFVGFLLMFLVSSGVPAQAQTTNIWGLEEGDKLTYTETFKLSGTGSGEEKTVYNIEIQRVDDWDNDNITDIAFSVEETLEGGTSFIDTDTIMGYTNFNYEYLIEIEEIFLPVAWVESSPPSQLTDGGLNWTAAIEVINMATVGYLADYNATVDDDKLTIETTTDRPHLYVNGTEAGADFDVEQKTVWDMEKGTLEEHTWTLTFNESLGLVIEETIKKGGPGLMDTISDNAIAIAGLALAVLALLLIILKR